MLVLLSPEIWPKNRLSPLIGTPAAQFSGSLQRFPLAPLGSSAVQRLIAGDGDGTVKKNTPASTKPRKPTDRVVISPSALKCSDNQLTKRALAASRRHFVSYIRPAYP